MFTIDRTRELVSFFRHYCDSESEAKKLVEKCGNLPKEKQNARTMINLIQRLIYLADNAEKLKPGRDALKLLFLIICAEAIAKLYKNFDGVGKSKEHVKIFLSELCRPDDIESLSGALAIEKEGQKQKLSLEEVIDYLYGVRCWIAHEGYYWGFHFLRPGVTIGMDYKSGNIVHPYITYEELRDIIIRGTIRAINQYIENGSKKDTEEIKKRIEEELGGLIHATHVASVNYEIWWVYKSKEYRPKYIGVMNRYSEFFTASIHAHFVAMLMALNKIYENRTDTFNIGKLINMGRDNFLIDAGVLVEIENPLKDNENLIKKIRILRNKHFAHIDDKLDYDTVLKKADIKYKNFRELIDLAYELLGRISYAYNKGSVSPRRFSKKDTLRLLNDLSRGMYK